MTAVLTNDDLLKFRVDGGASSLECANAFLLNVFLQGSLARRMEGSGLSSSAENILSPPLIDLSSPNRRLETAK